MKRKVKIGELKARLSEHLRHVRKGHTITVMDRDTPVAEISIDCGSPLHQATSKKPCQPSSVNSDWWAWNMYLPG